MGCPGGRAYSAGEVKVTRTSLLVLPAISINWTRRHQNPDHLVAGGVENLEFLFPECFRFQPEEPCSLIHRPR